MKRPGLAVALLATVCATASFAQTPRIVAFGDSITRGLGDGANLGGYPGRLQNLLATAGETVTVVNQGKDGETTAAGLSRLNGITGASGDTLVLMEGTNDVSANISNETIATNLKNMVRKGRANGFTTVLLATVLPRSPKVEVPETREITHELAWQIRQAAVDVAVGQPEPFEIFADIPGVYTTLYYDAFHPNSQGYDDLAQIFADYLLGRDTVAPTSSFVQPLHDSVDVAPNAQLQVILFDPLTGVDTSQSTLLLDGSPIPTTVTGSGRRVVLTAQPGGLVGRPILGVSSRDRATPANLLNEDVSQFTVKGTQFVVGDIDQSGRVDGADLVRLGYSFGAAQGDARYKASADLNHNGKVDGTDLALLAANFGLSSF